jgi:hypothetical protein
MPTRFCCSASIDACSPLARPERMHLCLEWQVQSDYLTSQADLHPR